MKRKRTRKRPDRADAPKQTPKKGKKRQKEGRTQPPAGGAPAKPQEQDEDCVTGVETREVEVDAEHQTTTEAPQCSDDQAARTSNEDLGTPTHSNQKEAQMRDVERQTRTVPHRTQGTQIENTGTTVTKQNQTQADITVQSEEKMKNVCTQTDLVLQTTQGTQTDPDSTMAVTQEPPQAKSPEGSKERDKKAASSPDGGQRQGSLKEEGDGKRGHRQQQASQKETKQQKSEKDTDKASKEGNAQVTSQNLEERGGEGGVDERGVEKMDTGPDVEVGSSTDPPDLQQSRTYAQAAANTTGSQTPPVQGHNKTPRGQQTQNMDTSQNQSTPPKPKCPDGPVFTIHMYAVLDKKFKFDQSTGQLFLMSGNYYRELSITHLRGHGKEEILIEATCSLPMADVPYGQNLWYHYGVQQKQKQIQEMATRCIQIPFDRQVKELIVYEGYITCSESWTGRLLNWMRSNEKAIGEKWQASASLLLDRIFQKWDKSDMSSVELLVKHLKCYQQAFGDTRHISYGQNWNPPALPVSEQIAAQLAQLLSTGEGKSKQKCPQHLSGKPLLTGFFVFQIANACGIKLDMQDLARLCRLVSSSAALQPQSTEEMQQIFPRSVHLVVGLMNMCARRMLCELVLLVPLLLTFRQPGADSRRLGGAVEEQGWSGLEGIEYSHFRDQLRRQQDKRRIMMELIGSNKSLAIESPHISISWLSMVAMEDIVEFAALSSVAPEYLIQSLMYRLRLYEQRLDNNTTPKVLEVAEGILTLLLTKVDSNKERLCVSEWVMAIFECCICVHNSTCTMARLVPSYKSVVLSFQLLLKFAEVVDMQISKTTEGEEKVHRQAKLVERLEDIQRQCGQWRDKLVQLPLLKNSKFSYPKEVELWDALFGVECTVKDVTPQWRSQVESDLRKRISQLQDRDRVGLCCLETAVAAIKKTHVTIQTCFEDSCMSSIQNICKSEKEGDLVKHVLQCSSGPPVWLLSAIIRESSARFTAKLVEQLLEPQSAIFQLLSHAGSQPWSLDDDANATMQQCQASFVELLNDLVHGDVRLGHLKTTLKHRENFKRLYAQCKRILKDKVISLDPEKLLVLRKDDLGIFEDHRAHMDTLIKMMGKISEVIVAPEMENLEQCHKADLDNILLNELVSVHTFSSDDQEKITFSSVLWYDTEFEILEMARKMHEVRGSSLLLSYWEEESKSFVSWAAGDRPVSLSLLRVKEEVWEPCWHDYLQLGEAMADASVTFKQLDMTLKRAGDQGSGVQINTELILLENILKDHRGLTPGWADQRRQQIQQYGQLHEASESACVILKIRDKLELTGDFQKIHCLTQMRTAHFQQRPLSTMSDELIKAKDLLTQVTPQHTASLQALLGSYDLVTWVKSNLKNLSDVKVFVDLASISAGENDTEIDRVANFHDAVMGYSPLLYSLDTSAGFDHFMGCVQQLWDTLNRDDKLPDKLRHSNTWLEWLKGLKETHGSVEQSSLSLAADINTHGVYQVQRLQGQNDKWNLQSMLAVRVRKDAVAKTYGLNELLELQNKLMLMSSKGDHGKEQVNRFTQVFEGVQRLAENLLQLQSVGNMLFRDWEATVHCSGKEPCIEVRVHLLQKIVLYKGEVTECLSDLCHSMEACSKDWCAYLSETRSQFPSVNHYSSEQLVYLSKSIHDICTKCVSVPQQVWHLLAPVKLGCTLSDVKRAFKMATAVENTNSDVDCADVQNSDMISEDGSEDGRADLSDDDEEDVEYTTDEGEEWTEELASRLSLQNDDDNTMDMESPERLDGLWQSFRDDMARYLKGQIDLRTLASFLTFLSQLNEHHIKRNLPPGYQEGRPNLVLCPATEVLRTALSVYMESPDQALPSTDEVLICQEDTTEEQVEIFLRRCLTRCVAMDHQKIYTLVNPDLLTYDVSVGLGERFEALDKKAGPHYRLVMVCPVTHQGRYVPSFFSNYKVLQAGINSTAEKARKYISHHFSIPSQHRPKGIYPENLSVWLISSERPAVGKSLYITRLFERFQTYLPSAQYIRITLIEPRVDMNAFLKTLTEKLNHLREQDPVLLHIDTAAVRFGIEEFLFQFLILGSLSDREGTLWRRNVLHLLSIEVLQPLSVFQVQPKEVPLRPDTGLLCTLPTIHCRPPKEVKDLQLKINNKQIPRTLDPLMDDQEFRGEGIQRPYQYLRQFNRNANLDRFKYVEGSVEGNHVDCLHHLLANCGLREPSWAELKHFTWFLNLQLKDCEHSIFCDADFFAEHLPGFKTFIVKFMIQMSKDFASPSMNISDQSPSLLSDEENEDDILARLTIRKRWETEPHPYIFFNADHMSMTFLGFNVTKHPRSSMLNAVDPVTRSVLVGNVMSPELFVGLERQRISLQEDFDSLPRETKIKKLSFVVGSNMSRIEDPDPSYELTADNVKKMLAIHMRFRCGIPVIIMGETGCGKTRLVRFLCDLQREGRDVQNMKLVKVHGGTTADIIYRKVREAERLAEENQRKYKLDTVLFFDEANTTEAIFAIKEVLCDRAIRGVPLKANSGLKIIAACNPYRRHSPDMVTRLERAGLGYRVTAGDTEDRLGKVPLRQLVYRVHPLPPSLIPLVWDFGQLSNEAELSYIMQIVRKQSEDNHFPRICQEIIANVLAVSQRYMRSRENECSFVSLRDVERSMRVLVWFYNHKDQMFHHCSEVNTGLLILKCLVLAVGVCYYPSLESKAEYLKTISKYFPEPLNNQHAIEKEIIDCQDLFLDKIKTRETIAKNNALKENVFLMVVCIELRIPLFLVGKPGSSKSLAKTVVADAMQGQNSQCEFFQQLKEVHMVSFQCSPHSSPEGIIGTFRNCARFQKEKDTDRYVSVVVLDEIGLAEDSPQMPLKTLHPLLEDGCIDSDESDPYMKVGFVGISNWALDPAKMNRGIFVSRWDPSNRELEETAQGICSSSNPILLKIKHLFPELAKAFLKICSQSQFFGLRDYYSLVKMIFAIVRASDREPSDSELAEAILRNFSGQCDDFEPLTYFQSVFQNFKEIPQPTTLAMVEQNLACRNSECRYLLILTTNNAALHILEQHIFSKGKYATPEIVFGSGFPKDQEYAQICRNVSRVKTCMETGRTVILLNLQNLYESLYDALNQYYVYLSGQQYVDLGLGSHRVKCRVHKDFRLVVVEDQEKVYKQFPVPLINRLEKHRVNRSTDLTPWQLRVLGKLMEWIEEFCKHSEEFKPADVFVGFHNDACASALLQALEMRDRMRCFFGQNVAADSPDSDPKQPAIEDETMSQTTREELEPFEAVGNSEHELIQSTDQAVEEMLSLPDQRETPQGGSESQEREDVDVQMVADKDHGSDGKKSVDPSIEQNLGEDVQMDMNVSTPEDEPSEMSSERMEEEVFGCAKMLLMNCATPDSVLRLKYARLGNQEKGELQKMYFHDQHHRSLRDFINTHLDQDDNHCGFVEITTFSSLLTKADVRTVAQGLGLSTERMLLLSLHQFDTETSFCSRIRHFLQNGLQGLHVLLVQMDTEETKCSEELIASAKYCTMNELNSVALHESRCLVIFITKLSRMTAGPQYIGFQGGVWYSVHIDDLRDTEDMSLDLSALCGNTMSALMSQSVPSPAAMTQEEGLTSVESQHGDNAHLDSLCLVRSCAQMAVALLKDTQTSRSMERIRIVIGLLGESTGKTTCARFQRVLLKRLVAILAEREEVMLCPQDWVNKEAKKRQALQESGTLRHTLWRCLQTALTPVLARVLEVLDRDANLDLAYCAGLSDGLIGLWLDIASDQQILDLTLIHTSSTTEEEIPVQGHLVLGGRSQPSAAPFSWLIRTHYQELWDEAQFIPGQQQSDSQRVQQFVTSASSSRLSGCFSKLSEQDRQEFGLRYLRDFVLLSFKVQSEEELQVLIRAELGCVHALQCSMSVSPAPLLSPAWILAAHRRYAARLDTLHHILQLQPHLAHQILQKDSQWDTTEMREDIWALGMCVEETKLQAVTSLQECREFLQRVLLLKSCVEGAFGQSYSALCSPGCIQHLNAIRASWCGMLSVAAFIEQVVLEVNRRDARTEDLTLKHCSLIHKLMEECPDLQNKDGLQQLIRILNSYHEESISRDLRFGLTCPVCLCALSEPCALPCHHVFCQLCLQRSLGGAGTRGGPGRCPKCRTALPADFQPTVSHSIRASLEQHDHMRRCCNSFFLEVVSRFCLRRGEETQGEGGDAPREEVVELLFSLLISTQGGVYKTRELSPFLECVDQSPVVRSVLPKLLLQHSFLQVKGHIQIYLQDLQQNLMMATEDRTELYLLFTNCFQDTLRCAAGGVDNKETHETRLHDDTAFLSRLARRQIPDRHQDPAEFLLSLARLRLCLGTAATLLQRALGQGQDVLGVSEQQYLAQVRAVCEYCGHDWYRVYLLRALSRLAGIDAVLALMNSQLWAWAFPANIIKLQRLIPADVDRFLCCGPAYRMLRDAAGQAFLEAKTDSLETAMQVASGTRRSITGHLVLLTMAIFRQVTCRLLSPDANLRPGPQELGVLEGFLKAKLRGELQHFSAALLSNHIGGRGSPLQLCREMSAQRRTLLELLVHAGAVLLSGTPLLSQLRLIAQQPRNMRQVFLPTMPDDYSSEAQQWMAGGREGNAQAYRKYPITREGSAQAYRCSNGHVAFVGKCGRPMALSKCAECGVPIGGENHTPVAGFSRVSAGVADQTQRGHALGNARQRSEAPNRQRTTIQSALLRLLTHLAMMLGASQDLEGVRAMVTQPVGDVIEFLFHHLEKDMEVIGRTLDLNLDDTAITIHLILHAALAFSGGSHQQRADLSSKQGREQWEKTVCTAIIDPVIQDLNKKLTHAQEAVSSDDRLAGSPLLRLLRSDPRPILDHPHPSGNPDCSTHHSSFWSVPEILSVERLTQVVEQRADRGAVPLLQLFLQKVPCVRQLRHLLELLRLQGDLMRVFPSESPLSLSSHTITQLLQQIHKGHQNAALVSRVKTFIDVWNCLRMELARDPERGVPQALCETELTMESSGAYLSPSRHGAGSCLRLLIDYLADTHNGLVREARRLNQEDSEYSVSEEGLSESHLALCHPEQELLPLVLAQCHYTLERGRQTSSSYNLPAAQRELSRRFLAGKPTIQVEPSKYLNRRQQDFSAVLADVRRLIPQEPVKGSVSGDMRLVLRSFTDVCDAVVAVEIGLRFLGKTGGERDASLVSYLRDSLRMGEQISSSMAKALGESRLQHSVATWQLLTCWKSELMITRRQDPFQHLSSEYQDKLSREETSELRRFLGLTDVDYFTRELHEILLLKTNAESPEAYASHWDITSTLETHLDQKGLQPPPSLHALPDSLTMKQAAQVWKTAVAFKT
ncbi:E3 ubiquitin-protein ligase rnf213-beta [Engraulis encrasicolus]|uniref:E3 ubiquitin-protein ligase rnf213-beta n=1 Tax=Engraulis encrasicolus TaxID=184585 RepID=UPI002FD5AAA6